MSNMLRLFLSCCTIESRGDVRLYATFAARLVGDVHNIAHRFIKGINGLMLLHASSIGGGGAIGGERVTRRPGPQVFVGIEEYRVAI